MRTREKTRIAIVAYKKGVVNLYSITKSQSIMPATEISLNLNLHPVPFASVSAEATNFISHFKTKQIEWTSPIQDSLEYSKLQSQVIAIMQPPTSGNYFRAIHIHYGLENDNIVLIYQPILAIQRQPDNEKCIYDIRPVQVGGNDAYFKYDGTDFISVTNQSTLRTNYIDDIRIKRSSTATHSPHTNGNAITDDVKSILFPVQEIEEVWKDNQEPTHLHIINTSKIDGSTGIYKHSVVFSPQQVLDFHIKRNQRGVFIGAAANLGNLCPPNCDKVMVKNDVILIAVLGSCE